MALELVRMPNAKMTFLSDPAIAASDKITPENFLSIDSHESEMDLFIKHQRTGRPTGDDAFIERLLDRPLMLKNQVQR